MEWLEEVGIIISGIVAILAWIAKARWSVEYSKAKEEVIRAKETQIKALEREIQALRDLSPMKIKEYFTSMQSQLEGYIDLLNKKLELALAENDELEGQIGSYQSMGKSYEEEISRLVEDKVRLEDQIRSLQKRLESLRVEYNSTSDMREVLIGNSNLQDALAEFLNNRIELDAYLDDDLAPPFLSELEVRDEES